MASCLTQTQTSQWQHVEDEALKLVFTITQEPLCVTLGASAIVATSLCLIVAIRLLQPAAVVALVALVPTILFIHNDFQNYLKLGPGGTPSTFVGYLKINWLKLWALRTPFEPLAVGHEVVPARGILGKKPLPYRCGPRPSVVGIAPQRQTDQFGSRECYMALRGILARHGAEHDNVLGLGTSCFEKHGLGLFARFPINNTCQGEIVHVHSSDYAMHMNLHPEDAKEVLAKGWGQRHPLTAQRWLKMPVPKNFTMVYAPRTQDELRIVCQIIQAAGYWVMGEDIEVQMN
ncbi:2,4-didehydro-3-deoxy-L-rhamnonate hydrolase [Microdochium nivale]|nr:2,4-didehydro-3-deoxy-L-rhamnonate hydrolase [Microdochium nivale]